MNTNQSTNNCHYHENNTNKSTNNNTTNKNRKNAWTDINTNFIYNTKNKTINTSSTTFNEDMKNLRNLPTIDIHRLSLTNLVHNSPDVTTFPACTNQQTNKPQKSVNHLVSLLLVSFYQALKVKSIKTAHVSVVLGLYMVFF
eukprot:TRINITY_DN3932_c0_g1_i10.p1 TRINITY_DN3932_c0_g1~~TRINITY_DN3932_c0_g1_i10.p1  ORF type:complete len:142 (+),score=23.69 TRINITY_DN3932_c0_g1_i10:745-1170(+)